MKNTRFYRRAAVLGALMFTVGSLSACTFVQKIPNGTSATVVAAESTRQEDQNDWELLNSLAIYKGVTINGIDVGGLNRLSAKQLIEQELEPTLDENKVNLQYGEFKYTFTERELGYYYDYDEISKQAFDIARTGEGEARLEQIKALPEKPVDIPSTLKVDAEKFDALIAKIAEDIHVSPANNSFQYDWDQGKVVAVGGELGRDVDIEALKKLVSEAPGTGNTDLEIPVYDVQPDPDYAAKAEQVNGIIGSADSTFLTGFWARIENIRVSTEALNGVVIGPGQTFSVNDYLGDTTPDKGYQMAIVIGEGNREVEGYGGGVCQTSTALYQAALRADLEILNRSPHTQWMPYAPTGLDATIEYGSADLVIRNPWDFPILIRSSYVPGYINFEIYGDTTVKDYNVSIWGDYLYSIPGKKTNGSAYRTYRQNDATGEVEVLSETVYPAIN
ncbi:MAG: VanW family protein [Tissierellia bacterium]|nr:VanW family protein [Tissierellia bacterium]